MAEEPTADEAPVTFNVKSSSDAKYVLTIPLSTTVLDLKTKLSAPDYADIPPDRQRLIYSGRVLKDPDTLASYKIKEGNTVHLVKGAASNQRQNPANQGSSTTTGTASQSSESQGVPANLAAGTGNNPLAGLTGARYAGFAQLPGAGMFGPDGGMGPPPGPEQMIEILQNPQYAAQLNEALSNPDIINQLINGNPMFRGMADTARQALQNPEFRRMMTDPEMLSQMAQMQRQFPGMFGGGGMGGGQNQAFPAPGVTDQTPDQPSGERTTTPNQPNTTPQQPPPNPFAFLGGPAPGAGGAGARGNPFAAFLGQPPAPSQNTPSSPPPGDQTGTTPQQQQQQEPSAQQNPFNQMAAQMASDPQFMQNMLGMLGGRTDNQGQGSAGGGEAGSGASFNPLASLFGQGGLGGFPTNATAPPDNRPPEERYAEQLRQLNDMGFYEFERNVEALRRTGGSVQGAVEYLLTH